MSRVASPTAVGALRARPRTCPSSARPRNSLIVKLTGKHASVNAFIHEVDAQSGKRIHADKAAILIALAQSL